MALTLQDVDLRAAVITIHNTLYRRYPLLAFASN